MTRRPCWDTINAVALEDANLPRVLAALGFDRYLTWVPRGLLAGWRPDYISVPAAWAETLPPGDASIRRDMQAAYLSRRRAEFAPYNRARRDAPCHLLLLARRAFWVDSYGGEWRRADGAVRGRNLLDLGAWRWACRYGQAGARIARLLGMDVPTLPAKEPHHA